MDRKKFVISQSLKSCELTDLVTLKPKQVGKLRILILADEKYPASVVKDHVQALITHSSHSITLRAPRRPTSRWQRYLPRKRISLLDETNKPFDVLIIHYSLCILFSSYIPSYLREEIRSFRGVKIQIIQDEYRWINRMVAEMKYLGIDGIISSLQRDNLDKVYRSPDLEHVSKISALPGYIPKRLVGLNVPPISQRKIHLFYRSRELPFWLGKMAYEKTAISEKVENLLNHEVGIVSDLSSREKDRIYGNAWTDRLINSKAVLGAEGGASIFDFDGSAETQVNQFLKKNPGATFEEVSEKVLVEYEGNIVHQTITPRIFESIALKTALVLFPGRYRGVLKPWVHYLPLERNLSNFEDILKCLKDDNLLQEMVNHCYRDIVSSGKYSDSILGAGVEALCEILFSKKKFLSCAA